MSIKSDQPVLDRVKIAFRKLKSSVYFDKTMLPLRDKVVEFEVSSNFHKNLEELSGVCDNILLGDNLSVINEIIDSICVLPFPKKMQDKICGENCVISVGNPKEPPVVSDLQYFINMDIRGHILGVLWIMAFGKRLDDCCYNRSFGNRLRSKLIWNDDDGLKDSPALFEPYFGQYSLWRDGGLSCAEDVLKKGQDALILTLDLKRFYYNTGITKKVFDSLLCEDDGEPEKRLHLAVFKIIERYTQVLKKRTEDIAGNVLPIGFLPSAVLSNWCLSKFDSGILNYWNPLYYGRYVDDIIIVEKN